MSAANGLHTVHIPDNLDLKLGELENNLIAKVILFKKYLNCQDQEWQQLKTK